MLRYGAYYGSLMVLSIVPLILILDFYRQTPSISDHLVRLIVSSKDIVTNDIDLLGEYTPPVVAAIIAALSPRPIDAKTGIFSILICLFGYLGYLYVTLQLEGKVLFFERSMLGWFEIYLEGNIPESTTADSLKTLQGFFDNCRVFYLVALGAIFGFMVNDQRRASTQ